MKKVVYILANILVALIGGWRLVGVGRPSNMMSHRSKIVFSSASGLRLLIVREVQ